MSGRTGRARLVDAVLEAVDATEVVALTRRLVSIGSENPPAQEEDVALALACEAQRLGLEGHLDYVAPRRPNVSIYGKGGGPDRRPSTLYCGHLDTVPSGEESAWKYAPLSGRVSGRRIWGRGSVDMKGGLAAMVCGLAALCTVRPEAAASVRIVAFVGEESDCAGSRHFVNGEKLDSVRAIVVGEPTGLRLAIAQKGAVRVRVTLRGRAAHGSRPELGMNAIVHMARVIDALGGLHFGMTAHRLLSPPTLSVNTVHGGIAANVVPDQCTVVVDVRTLPGEDQDAVVHGIQECVHGVTSATPGLEDSVELLDAFAAVETDTRSRLFSGAEKALAAAGGKREGPLGVTYYSDASVLMAATSATTVLFGPGEVELMHQANESVRGSDVVTAARWFAVLPLLM